MSTANKCDRCGVLYEPTPRAIYINEIGIATRDDPSSFSTWNEIELCPSCSARVIDALGDSLEEINKLDAKLGTYKKPHKHEPRLLHNDDRCVCGLPAINVLHRYVPIGAHAYAGNSDEPGECKVCTHPRDYPLHVADAIR